MDPYVILERDEDRNKSSREAGNSLEVYVSHILASSRKPLAFLPLLGQSSYNHSGFAITLVDNFRHRLG